MPPIIYIRAAKVNKLMLLKASHADQSHLGGAQGIQNALREEGKDRQAR